jgi:hypothetical protein
VAFGGTRGVHVEIDPQDRPDTREAGRFADVGDLFPFQDPELAGVDFTPFFSVVCASACRSAVPWELARTASSRSGWLSLTAKSKSPSASRITRARGRWVNRASAVKRRRKGEYSISSAKASFRACG